MIPARFEPFVVGAILSGLMSLVVSGIATLRAMGFVPSFAGAWISAWLTAWVFAFPIVMLVGPVARRAARRLVERG